MKKTVAGQFAEFAAQLDFDDIPNEAIRIAKRCLVDGTATILAGSTEPCTAILRQYAAAGSGNEEAATLGAGNIRVPLQTAALINGTASYALDWDDTALSSEPETAQS